MQIIANFDNEYVCYVIHTHKKKQQQTRNSMTANQDALTDVLSDANVTRQ